MNNAEQLFKQVVEGGESLIQRFVVEGKDENLYLDFKTAQSPMSKDDNKNLAEAISGFANSEGGVIIWGVDCRHQSDGVDIARELKPIIGLERFIADLRSGTAQYISPGLTDIIHEAIPTSRNSDDGYVVTFVPKWNGEPQMAIAAKQHRYYIRVGACFMPMEAYQIADRYRRRPQPKLELCTRFSEGYPGHHTYHKEYNIAVLLSLCNKGIGIALYPALIIYNNNQFYDIGLSSSGNPNQIGLNKLIIHQDRYEDRKEMYVGGIDSVIHPGMTLDITRVIILIPDIDVEYPDITLKYDLYCEGFYEKNDILIPGNSIIKHARKIWFRDDQVK